MQDNELLPVELTNETIESMIYEIRGQKVMLDFELAKIYGYETKRFNEQVKNNLVKFPERYRFQLSSLEVEQISRSKKSTAMPIMQTEGMKGGRTSLPWAFTEQGIYMLMTVLKGELATRQSIALIDAFKQMKDYIVENNGLLMNSNPYLESRFASIDKRFAYVPFLPEKFRPKARGRIFRPLLRIPFAKAKGTVFRRRPTIAALRKRPMSRLLVTGRVILLITD